MTSFASNVAPSWNVTPSRRWQVHTEPSSFGSQLVARAGWLQCRWVETVKAFHDLQAGTKCFAVGLVWAEQRAGLGTLLEHHGVAIGRLHESQLFGAEAERRAPSSPAI